MMKDSAGVSPVIATILLIAITVVAVGVVMAFVAGLPTPTPPLIASITIENAVLGMDDNIIIWHTSGDPIGNWQANLEIRLNANPLTGATIVPIDHTNFVVGDKLSVDVGTTALASGDVITVIYKPANQELTRVTVP